MIWLNMIRFTNDNIFTYAGRMMALVNPVNSVGVMGAGLARQFAYTWPDMVMDYKADVRNGVIKAGAVTWGLYNHTFIVNAATKDHFSNPSSIFHIHMIMDGILKIEDDLIEAGAIGMVIPKLGCGLGGLMWANVKPIFIEKLSAMKLPITVT